MNRRSTQKRYRARGTVLRCLLNEDFSAPGFLPELLLDCDSARHEHQLLWRPIRAWRVLFGPVPEVLPITLKLDGHATAFAVHDAARKGGGES